MELPMSENVPSRMSVNHRNSQEEIKIFQSNGAIKAKHMKAFLQEKPIKSMDGQQMEKVSSVEC